MIESFDPTALTEARFERDQERQITSEGYGSTKGAVAIINKYITEVYTKVSSEHKALKSTRVKPLQELYEHIGVIDPKTLSVVGLHSVLSSIGSCYSIGRTALNLGRAIEFECFAFSLKSTDEKRAARTEAFVRRKHSGLKQRRVALRSIAKKQGAIKVSWPSALQLKAGEWLLDCLIDCGAFALVSNLGKGKAAYVTLTEEAFSYQEDFVRQLLDLHPVFAPIKQRPQPWTAVRGCIKTHGKSFGIRLIRTRNRKLTDAVVQQAIDEGKMDDVLKAMNTIQDVAWKINPSVLEMVRWAYTNGVKCGLPAIADIEAPQKPLPWDDMNEDQRKAWRKSAETVVLMNRDLSSQRTALHTSLSTADYLGTDTFWTPTNMDYRGRVYPICHFNFQRAEAIRAMFQFADGKPLGPDGLYWLKVHLANCGDFNKVSKASFDDRVAWVDENVSRILKVANDPKRDLWWTEADCPFLFMAACIDLGNAYAKTNGNPSAYVSHIPVSFDGSCSGLQHLCAMTRAPEGILVNLGATPKANDIYRTVAEKLKLRLEAETDPEKQLMAQMALAYGVDRSFVKRQVMTYAYSSKAGGMSDQIKDDIMSPLHYKVLSGELSEHPFGEDWYKVASYLATEIYQTIEEVVQYPAEAMKYLQRIASTMSHESKHLVWTTPLGLPVVLKYANQEASEHRVYLSDLRVRMNLNDEVVGIDKNAMRNAIAPCFVHSYDACHLMMVVNASMTPDVALVHDSFGCHAGVAQEFREVLTQTFVDLYDNRDPLADILREAHDQIDTNSHRLPQAIPYGSLNIKDVLNAEYAFA